jgi:hypothetical protein
MAKGNRLYGFNAVLPDGGWVDVPIYGKSKGSAKSCLRAVVADVGSRYPYTPFEVQYRSLHRDGDELVSGGLVSSYSAVPSRDGYEVHRLKR